jgi:hypothetical protein
VKLVKDGEGLGIDSGMECTTDVSNVCAGLFVIEFLELYYKKL